MDPQKPQTSSCLLRYTNMILAILFTASNNILLKFQDKQNSDTDMPYTHPFVQCTIMYFGQFLCLIIHCITKEKTVTEYDNSGNIKKPAPFYVFALPALIDSIGVICFTYGLVFCSLSISQIIGALLIVSSAIFSFLILRKKIRSFHVLSIILIIIGVAIAVVATQVLNNNADDINATSIWGVLMLIIGNIIWSFQYITEEKFFSTYQVSSLQAIGMEGLIGMLYYVIIIVILQFVPCHFVRIGNQVNNGFCVYGKIEDVSKALAQIRNSLPLLLSSIGYILTTTFSNVCMMAIIKYGMAVHSCIVTNARTVLIWSISLIFKWEKFNWLELIGFLVFVAVGSFVYHEMVMLPMFKNKDIDTLNNVEIELLEDEKKYS